MKQEINVALDLLAAYVQRFGTIKEASIEEFRNRLEQVLLERYQGHWYPDKPIKGQAYRSLEFNKENDFCDAIVGQLCLELGFAPNLLGILHELTLWIDPYEVTIRLGSHACPKENQQMLVARFDKDGNELIHYDLDTLLAQSRVPMCNNNNNSNNNNTSSSRLSPTHSSSSCDSTNCSGSSTPQRTSSPFSMALQPTMYHNGPLFTPPRALSPQAPIFQMLPSAPISVPRKKHHIHPLRNMINAESPTSEGSPIDGMTNQPDRSDTPHSVNSTTSNESSDSGYCGYVESFPYYYKLNRLYKALAIQKFNTGAPQPMGKVPHYPTVPYHHRRVPYHHHQQQQQQQQNVIPACLSNSPPTPTPMNINQLAPFYVQQTYLPVPTTVTDGRKSKY